MRRALAALLASVGRRTRAARESRGLTQRETAERAELDLNYYGLIERGKRNVTLATVARIAAALEVSPFDLLSGDTGVSRARIPEADRIAMLLEKVSEDDRAAVLRVLEGFAAYERPR